MHGLHLTADLHGCRCAPHWLTDADALGFRLQWDDLIAAGYLAIAALVLGFLFYPLYRLFRLSVDLDQRRRAARALATSDALTGLANRRGFAEALETHFHADTALALLYLDLDDFGRLTTGKHASFVVLSQNLELGGVWIRGKALEA